MSSTTKRKWITGEEYGRLRRELIDHGVPDDAPEFVELNERVHQRDEALWELFGKPYMETYRGKWIAIALDGTVIIRDTASEVVWAGARAFGEGNFAMRKLAEFPGHVVRGSFIRVMLRD
jgi:hypothetical protein